MNPKYLRMLKDMKSGRKRDWNVYILRCADGSLYTGIAKDVGARLKQHNAGKGAAYVRPRLPVVLLYQENGMTHSKALIREAKIKTMPKTQKEKLVLANGKLAHRNTSRA